MLIFIDESGDPGFKFRRHSSDFFSIGLVVFMDRDQAMACDQRISLLRKEIKVDDNFEFHYTKNSDKIKDKFLSAVVSYDFFYYGMIVQKKKLTEDVLKMKMPFYHYVCGLMLENMRDKLDEAIIIMDKTGSGNFEKELFLYLRRKFNDNLKKRILKIKMQDSHRNNLLQLADYVASG